METFQPGDRVVAINTDHSRQICGPANPGLHPFTFPDGRLREGPIYHVASVGRSRIGNPTLWITGLRVFWGNQEMPWDGTRFRKVDALKDFPKARRKSQISNSKFDTLHPKTLTDSTHAKSDLMPPNLPLFLKTSNFSLFSAHSALPPSVGAFRALEVQTPLA